jgi:hypothetical protein
MNLLSWRLLALCWLALLVSCGGGGDSTTTTISGGGINNLGQSPAVSTNPVQTDNNLLVSVGDGPRGFQLAPNANILYATVTVCSPTDASKCVDIDHVQVDTGSVGLRVLASKVKSLNLPPVEISSRPEFIASLNPQPPSNQVLNTWECFPFVIGGLWGANATAVVGLGRQVTSPVAIQLIEDETDPTKALQPPTACTAKADGNILSSAGALGSNGILGVGSTNLDCGAVCLDGSYAANGTFVQYYGCLPGALAITKCDTSDKVDANLQVSNPISAFTDSRFNNGLVLVMPAVTNPGAATASGELIFGVDTIASGSSVFSNNTVPLAGKRVMLGVDPVNNLDSYLNITTQLLRSPSPQIFYGSYLDTGTNGLFFNDSSSVPIPKCNNSTWYCPASTLTLNAVLSDGGSTTLNQVNLQFQVGNAEALFSTSNTAFVDASGAAPVGSTDFAWGMPFFYGKRVYLSIWDITSFGNAAPWYAWTLL